MIQEAYVSFETAKLLKEKGFDVPCNSLYRVISNYDRLFPELKVENYTNNWNNLKPFYYSVPTHQMVLAYLRKKGVYIDIITSFDLNGKDHYSYTIYQNGKLIRKIYTSFDWCHEEATEVAIKYSLENLI